MVLATQNPLEQEGTYPLPEAQVDRFIMKVIVRYPEMQEEQLILRSNVQSVKVPEIKPVVNIEDVLYARNLVRDIYLDEKVEKYILDIIFATRYPGRYELKSLNR